MRWRFINLSSPEDAIEVHDRKSAHCLAEVLKHVPGDWIMQEEKSLSRSLVPPPGPALNQQQEEPFAPHFLPEPKVKHSLPTPAARQVTAPATPTAPEPVTTAAEIAPKPKNHERRSQTRFTAEFRVILISGTSSFRTVSRDVSLGGMRLKKSIPASFIKDHCVVYVSHKDMRENLEMVCTVIADPNDPCRIQFVKPDLKQLKRLEEWINEKRASGQEVA